MRSCHRLINATCLPLQEPSAATGPCAGGCPPTASKSTRCLPGPHRCFPEEPAQACPSPPSGQQHRTNMGPALAAGPARRVSLRPGAQQYQLPAVDLPGDPSTTHMYLPPGHRGQPRREARGRQGVSAAIAQNHPTRPNMRPPPGWSVEAPGPPTPRQQPLQGSENQDTRVPIADYKPGLTLEYPLGAWHSGTASEAIACNALWTLA